MATQASNKNFVYVQTQKNMKKTLKQTIEIETEMRNTFKMSWNCFSNRYFWLTKNFCSTVRSRQQKLNSQIQIKTFLLLLLEMVTLLPELNSNLK
jgi:hypothetical protein